MIPSYPKIYGLGHKAIQNLFDGPVNIQEKVDGSQISFMRKNSELYIRSKGAVINVDYPEKMFTKAVEVIKELQLRDGLIYRCEYLQKPKHNTLAYDRVPKNHLMLFDIDDGLQDYETMEGLKEEAEKLGIECVPLFFDGFINSIDDLKGLLDQQSVLGGQKIEGVVIKQYEKFGEDGKVLMGKHVSEAFKEVHTSEFRKTNPTNGDIIEKLVESYKSEARWNKSIQHLKEKGELLEDPKDIGNLLKEIHIDTNSECQDAIKEQLFKWAWPKIARGITSGFPEFYKNKLMEKQFDR